MPDILIRGISLPEGELKYVTLWVYGDGRVYVSNNASAASSQRLPDFAISLPEGHGDLIDRDAFRAENGLNAKCENCPTNTYECQRDMIHTKMEFCGMLDDAPIIVPAEGGADDV